MPTMPEGVEEGILKGLYKFKAATEGQELQGAHLSAAAPSCDEALRAQEILAERFGCRSRRLERDQLQTAARRCRRKPNAGTCCIPPEPPQPILSRNPCSSEKGVFVAVSDYLKVVPRSDRAVDSRRAHDARAPTASAAATPGRISDASLKSTPNPRPLRRSTPCIKKKRSRPRSSSKRSRSSVSIPTNHSHFISDRQKDNRKIFPWT